MIIRNLQDCLASRKVEDPNGNWNSVRMLLKADGMGFSFHITTIYANNLGCSTIITTIDTHSGHHYNN